MNIKPASKLLAWLPALAMAFSSASSFAGGPPPDAQPQKLVHNWESISFGETPPDPKAPIFSAGFGEHAGGYSNGFRVDILNLPMEFYNSKAHAVTARLYRANGEVVEPTEEGKRCLADPVGLNSGMKGQSAPPQVMTFFPWGPNKLEECWVGVTLGAERYWLEIPYGFDRDPKDPLAPPNSGGPPKFATAMKSLDRHDHILRWQSVTYDLGVIQNNWRLSLVQSNPFDAKSEVVLYRDDTAVGKSMYLWDTRTPLTSARVLGVDGGVVKGYAREIQLHDDGMRRSDFFAYDRNSTGKRCWGQIEIKVDDKTYRTVIPSSLYQYTEGHVPVN